VKSLVADNEVLHRQKLFILKLEVRVGLISSQMAVYGLFCF
jgi:hypothetical protein